MKSQRCCRRAARRGQAAGRGHAAGAGAAVGAAGGAQCSSSRGAGGRDVAPHLDGGALGGALWSRGNHGAAAGQQQVLLQTWVQLKWKQATSASTRWAAVMPGRTARPRRYHGATAGQQWARLQVVRVSEVLITVTMSRKPGRRDGAAAAQQQVPAT